MEKSSSSVQLVLDTSNPGLSGDKAPSSLTNPADDSSLYLDIRACLSLAEIGPKCSGGRSYSVTALQAMIHSISFELVDCNGTAFAGMGKQEYIIFNTAAIRLFLTCQVSPPVQVKITGTQFSAARILIYVGLRRFLYFLSSSAKEENRKNVWFGQCLNT